MVADCPKFIPNIFNNTKCSSCFKTREEHGDVALDSKSLRKVIKCGYLFVAPRDWDFCNPSIHRTKRWQRRWFVLWSDDQLTWSIDDQPDTIPQGSLDMREILEVKSAEEITENAYSLALTGKHTTFIKGMNNEDIKSWQSVLSKYGNRLITGPNGKRSLTLPGGFSSSNSARFETGVVIGPSRQRFHSVTSPTPPSPTYGKCSLMLDNEQHDKKHDGGDVFITAVTPKTVAEEPASTKSTSRSFYVSMANVPKGKALRTFPVSTSTQLSSTISPPVTHTPPTEEIRSPTTQPNDYSNKVEESYDVPDCPNNSVRALRGDPDGCGGLDSSDGGPLRKGWLLRQTNNEWVKHWFVLQNNSLIYYENSEELHPLGNIEVNEHTIIRQFESSRHYGFEVLNKSSCHKLSAITNGMRGIWMKALEASKVKPRTSEIQESSKLQNPNPPSPPLKSKKARWRKKSDTKILENFESLKDQFNQRERELNDLHKELRVESPRMRELVKSQAVQIDNFRSQLSSGLLEIEKLENYCKTRETEFQESLKTKDEIVEELKEQLNSEVSLREKLIEESRTLENQLEIVSKQILDLKRFLKQTEEDLDMESIKSKELESLLESQSKELKSEIWLLTQRCNDLTEKLYQSEKTAKSLKTKLGRVKSQSLKDRQIETDVINKISDLEEKISKLDNGSASSSTPSVTSPVPHSPSAGGIVNVIMKLNDLDQRVEKAVDSYWFRRGELEELVGSCQNCKLLEMEVQEREERLLMLEENLIQLEDDFNNKVKELKEFVKDQPGMQMETSPTNAQAVNKYQVEIEQLRNLCAKGLEAMENSHRRMVLELEEKHKREIQTLRIEKENELAEETKATLAALDAMRKNHQVELQKEMEKFKEEFMRKFESGQDLSNLHREHEQELKEVKEEILRLSDKYSLKCVEASNLEETISCLKQQLNEAKRRILDLEGNDFHNIVSVASSSSKKPDQVTALRSRLEQLILSRPNDEAKTKTQDDQTVVKSGGSDDIKVKRHSIMRSPSCPKLGEARLTLIQ